MIFAYPTFHRAIDSALWSPRSKAPQDLGGPMGSRERWPSPGTTNTSAWEVTGQEVPVGGRAGLVLAALPDINR